MLTIRWKRNWDQLYQNEIRYQGHYLYGTVQLADSLSTNYTSNRKWKKMWGSLKSGQHNDQLNYGMLLNNKLWGNKFSLVNLQFVFRLLVLSFNFRHRFVTPNSSRIFCCGFYLRMTGLGQTVSIFAFQLRGHGIEPLYRRSTSRLDGHNSRSKSDIPCLFIIRTKIKDHKWKRSNWRDHYHELFTADEFELVRAICRTTTSQNACHRMWENMCARTRSCIIIHWKNFA